MTETRPFMLRRIAAFEERRAELTAIRLPSGCWDALWCSEGGEIAAGQFLQTRRALHSRELVEAVGRPDVPMVLTPLGLEVAAWIQGRTE